MGRYAVAIGSQIGAAMPERRFPPPWSAEVTPNCFIVRDADGQQLAYVYYENEPGRRSAAKLLTKDEARRLRRISPSWRSYCAGEVVAKGRGERTAWVEYNRPLTRSSHLSSGLRPFATLNARKAVRDLAPQTPSAGPFRNRSSISRFCAAIISLGGGFNLLGLA